MNTLSLVRPTLNGVWISDFSEVEGITTVTISIKHKTPETIEQMIAMGFKEGFTMTLNYLVELLNTMQS